jgi:hypothetical protein
MYSELELVPLLDFRRETDPTGREMARRELSPWPSTGLVPGA